ncbi:MAG: hypothetical protein R3E85_03460 [Planctomycetota bacterium]
MSRSLLLALSAVLLAAGLGVSLRARGLPYQDGAAAPRAPVREHVPLAELGRAARTAWTDGDVEPLWASRLWYPYALAPLWVLALLLGGGAPHGLRRKLAGGLLVLVTLAVIPLEAAYLSNDYVAFLPPPFGDAEGVVVFVCVLFVLLARRPRDRHLAAVEGHVAAQALLSFLHMLTIPGTFARRWIEDGADVHAATTSLVEAFPLPFVVATAAFLGIAVVGVFGPRRAAGAQGPARS